MDLSAYFWPYSLVTAIFGLWSLAELHRGALMRVELRLDRTELSEVHPDLLDAIVAKLARRVSGDPAVRAAGLQVEGGCTTERCIVAVEGLESGFNAAKSALTGVAQGDPPRFSLAERIAGQKAWRDRKRSDDAVVEAALTRSFSPPRSQARLQLDARSRSPHFARRWVNPLWQAAQGASPISPAPVIKVDPAHFSCHDIGDRRDRAWVAVVWASTGTGDDLLRDALIAGDFQSLAVQELREGATTYTYDVTSESGAGWAAATFQVDAAIAEEGANKLARLVAAADATDVETLRSAYRRLAARHAGARDTLAGALADLPALPPAPAGQLPEGRVLGTIILGGAPVADLPHCTREEALLGRARP